jgi:hypothetical protein
MIKRLYHYFSKPNNLSLLNAILIVTIVALNIYFQVFCIPVPWVIIVLVLSFSNTILYPILAKSKLAQLTCFINGISFFIFIYCIVFLEFMNLFGLAGVILGIGVVVLIPHFIVIQLIWNNLIRPTIIYSRHYFIAAILLCTSATIYIGHVYKKAIGSMEHFKASGYTELDKNFMTEKILGMHFIYHTRFCGYDGWRPPKHEPILVIGMWLNHRIDPLNVDLKTRLELYRKFFPDNGYKFKCSCGIQYSQNYHEDDLWKLQNPGR